MANQNGNGVDSAKMIKSPYCYCMEPPPPRKPSRRRPRAVTEVTYRGYDADYDSLARVGSVTPAEHRGKSVVAPGHGMFCLLIEVETLGGERRQLLVCRSGWLPVQLVDGQDDVSPRGPWRYTTDVSPGFARMTLSVGDRKKIAGAILGQYLGKRDWEQHREWERGSGYP